MGFIIQYDHQPKCKYNPSILEFDKNIDPYQNTSRSKTTELDMDCQMSERHILT
ncbi:hypothetical protein NZNM25_09030 [Nitrosopumilus zosterae]|uniref:Uncharacterized protein n=1 Tax=Nitrosopumilus zosterae TaxID=718286 RepID=A0A2S2KR22_9ARCH|nr:hypothetical protein NZNM25_09030 [Nitrosopumilus zosterae]